MSEIDLLKETFDKLQSRYEGEASGAKSGEDMLPTIYWVMIKSFDMLTEAIRDKNSKISETEKIKYDEIKTSVESIIIKLEKLIAEHKQFSDAAALAMSRSVKAEGNRIVAEQQAWVEKIKLALLEQSENLAARGVEISGDVVEKISRVIMEESVRNGDKAHANAESIRFLITANKDSLSYEQTESARHMIDTLSLLVKDEAEKSRMESGAHTSETARLITERFDNSRTALTDNLDAVAEKISGVIRHEANKLAETEAVRSVENRQKLDSMLEELDARQSKAFERILDGTVKALRREWINIYEEMFSSMPFFNVDSGKKDSAHGDKLAGRGINAYGVALLMTLAAAAGFLVQKYLPLLFK